MFCGQCGNAVPDDAKFCALCGVEVNNPNGENPAVWSAGENSGQNMLNQSERTRKEPLMIAIIAISIIVFIVGNCVVAYAYFNWWSDPVDMVKNGKLNAYPEQTVGEAFDSFFSNCKWVSYKEDEETYVKFTGRCMLKDELVNAKIIFLIDGKKFEIDTCKIGDYDFTYESDAMEILLDKIYEIYE